MRRAEYLSVGKFFLGLLAILLMKFGSIRVVRKWTDSTKAILAVQCVALLLIILIFFYVL